MNESIFLYLSIYLASLSLTKWDNTLRKHLKMSQVREGLLRTVCLPLLLLLLQTHTASLSVQQWKAERN